MYLLDEQKVGGITPLYTFPPGVGRLGQSQVSKQTFTLPDAGAGGWGSSWCKALILRA